jgi:hypothetical protein
MQHLRIHTYARNVKSFVMHTYKIPQNNSFRMLTYKKYPGVVGPVALTLYPQDRRSSTTVNISNDWASV